MPISLPDNELSSASLIIRVFIPDFEDSWGICHNLTSRGWQKESSKSIKKTSRLIGASMSKDRLNNKERRQ